MASMQELAQVVQQLQQQVQQVQAENQVLRERMTSSEAQAQAGSPTAGGYGGYGDVLDALRNLPEALSKLNKPKSLIDSRGLGKPQVLGDDAEAKFRLWSVKLEDYVVGVFGGKTREALEWAATMDVEITEKDIRESYGEDSDPMDTWDDIHDFDSQLYSVLRATT